MSGLRTLKVFLAGMAAAGALSLTAAYAGEIRADEIGTRLDSAMLEEIAAAHTRLQKATENIGCLVTATGVNETALARILDTLNDGEVRLREARRLAQSAASDDERTLAISHARATLALVDQAESQTEQAGLN